MQFVVTDLFLFVILSYMMRYKRKQAKGLVWTVGLYLLYMYEEAVDYMDLSALPMAS